MIRESWDAIVARIKGWVKAGELCGRQDTSGALRRLRPAGARILKDVVAFRDAFRQHLPTSAIELIDREASAGHFAEEPSETPDTANQRVWSAMVALTAFEAEMTYLLNDRQSNIRLRTELAFVHLRRSIVVDPSLRDNWLAAFNEHETACERLGAVHLLLHGVWAFKVHGQKARTDLVYQEPINLDDVQRSATGLVLTEWKLCRENDDPEQKYREAREQAGQYASGMLAGIELSAFRYAVVVPKAQAGEPQDQFEGAVTWRHINVPLCPPSPSKAARAGSRSPC